MNLSIITLSFLVFFSCSSVGNSELQKKDLSSLDLTAKNLHKIFHSKIDQIKIDDLKNSITGVNREKVLGPYKSWIITVSEIYYLEGALKKLEYCEQNVLNQSNKYAYSFMHKNLLIKCRDIAKKSLNLDKINADLITRILITSPDSLFKVSDQKLSNLLSRLKDNITKNRVNFLLTQEYLKNQVPPSKEILKYVSVTSELSNLISEYGLDFKVKRKKYFNDLFYKIKKLYPHGGTAKFTEKYSRYIKSIENEINVNAKYLNYPKSVEQLLNFILFLNRNKKSKSVRTILSSIKRKYTLKKDQLDNLYFNNIWSYIQENDFKSAYRYIENNNLFSTYDSLFSKSQYWIANVVEKIKGIETAIEYKKRLIKNNPISYYASLVMKNLQSSNPEAFKIISNVYLNDINWNEDKVEASLQKKYPSTFERIKTFSEVGANSLISLEVKEMKNNFFKENLSMEKRNSFYYAITKKLHESRIYLLSFQLLFQALERKDISLSYGFFKKMFPKPFGDSIKEKSNSVDQTFLYSLIRQESGFNPEAQSRVGAMGLMQLMPNTAKRYNKKITKKDLVQPEKNLQIGTQYLKDLLVRYNQNLVHVLSAYNAGERRIDDWKKVYLTQSSKLKNIEHIPFAETRKYVKLIMRNMYFYNLIERKKSGAINLNKIEASL